MASDDDEHVLGDPFSRALRVNAAPSLQNETPPTDLTDAELRRELANVDVIVREAPTQGMEPNVLAFAERRRQELSAEYERRSAENGPA